MNGQPTPDRPAAGQPGAANVCHVAVPVELNAVFGFAAGVPFAARAVCSFCGGSVAAGFAWHLIEPFLHSRAGCVPVLCGRPFLACLRCGPYVAARDWIGLAYLTYPAGVVRDAQLSLWFDLGDALTGRVLSGQVLHPWQVVPAPGAAWPASDESE